MKKFIRKIFKKKGSDEHPAPKGEIGGPSSTMRNGKEMKDYLEHSKQKMKTYLKMVEDRQKPSNNVPIVGWPQAEEVKFGLRTVEVVASFDQMGKPAGGGFLLRNAAGTAILAEAFPLQGESSLFAEVCALREALEMSIVLVAGLAGDIVFLFESAELAKCFTEPIFPKDYAGPIINECRDLLRAIESEFMQLPGEQLMASKWLAELGRTSQQHSVFDNINKRWPLQLAELLARPPPYRVREVASET